MAFSAIFHHLSSHENIAVSARRDSPPGSSLPIQTEKQSHPKRNFLPIPAGLLGRPGELAAGFGLKHETLERFLGVLKTMYLVDEVPAWQGGDYDGVGKRAKWFAGDTGMMTEVP